MISGVGVDLVSINRFKSMSIDRRNKLANRILDVTELEMYNVSKDSAKFLAKYWSVKEAVSKSFGTGIRGNVVWKNIVLTSTELGQPVVSFQNTLLSYNKKCHVSISHESDMLISYAILTND
jgi:holo-[acyl-carrier protein] synthase